MLDEDAKKKIDARMRRIAGQVAGVQRMIDEDRYCVDVMLQIAAVRSALGRVGQMVLAQHVDTCVSTALKGDDPKERKAKIEELMEIFDKYGLR